MEHQQQKPHDSWHLKREISISHIFTTMTLLVGALWWASGVEKRISVLEVTGEQQTRVLKERLNRIEDKLDRLIQRELNNGNGH